VLITVKRGPVLSSSFLRRNAKQNLTRQSIVSPNEVVLELPPHRMVISQHIS